MRRPPPDAPRRLILLMSLVGSNRLQHPLEVVEERDRILHVRVAPTGIDRAGRFGDDDVQRTGHHPAAELNDCHWSAPPVPPMPGPVGPIGCALSTMGCEGDAATTAPVAAAGADRRRAVSRMDHDHHLCGCGGQPATRPAPRLSPCWRIP